METAPQPEPKKISKEEEEEKNIEFSLSNVDIKFPTFYDEELDKCFRNEQMSKDILINDLSKTINILKEISNSLLEVIRHDTNTFSTLCDFYKVNSYDNIIIIKLIQELAEIILSKIKCEDLSNKKLTTFEDCFTYNEKDKDIILKQHIKEDVDFLNIKERLEVIFDDIKEVYYTNNECGIPLMCYIVKYFNKFLLKVQTQLLNFIKIENFNNKDIKILRKNKIIFFDLIDYLEKIEGGDLVLHNAYMVNKNDLGNFDENSEKWKDIKRVMYRVNSKYIDIVQEEGNKMGDAIENVTVFFNKGVDADANIFKNIGKGTGLLMKFAVNSDDNLMLYESKESKLSSNKIMFEEFMKLGKMKLFRMVRDKMYPKIQFREKVYLKKEYPEINLEYIRNLLIKIYDEEIINKNFPENIKQPDHEILDENLKINMPIWARKLKKEDKKYFVCNTILNSYDLEFNKEPYYNNKPKNLGIVDVDIKQISKNMKNEFQELFSKNKNKIKPTNLLIHIHGGGFLECNTFFHEQFLREVCNVLQIPVWGIDYGCAPKHKYPEALNDCFQSYMWILNHCENEFGIKPEKIILSGDSSGGNLILSLTFLIISMNIFENKNIKIPDLLFPLYPCCHAGCKNMTLSLALSMEDYLLNVKSFKYINKSYRGYYNNEIDPFLNPVEANEILLKKLPKIRFMTAAHDPLRDDAIRLIDKIAKIPGMDILEYDLSYYQHGFMGHDNLKVRGPPHTLYYKEVREVLEKKDEGEKIE